MEVYRLSKAEYAKDTLGTGAKLFGGRWNKVNQPCIYTSSSRALAILEFSVNVNVQFFPMKLSIVTFKIDERYIEVISDSELPKNWRENPIPVSTQNLGNKRLESGVGILRVPSSVVAQEYNYILNPSLDIDLFSIIDVSPFPYDVRIKK